KVSVEFGLAYTRSRLRSAGTQQPITTASLWSCASPGCEPGRGLPTALDSPIRGYLSYVPDVYEDNIQGYEDLNRNTISTTLRYKPFTWFSHRVTVGGDYTNQQLSGLWKKISTVGSLFPTGRRELSTNATSYVSADYAGAAKWQPLSARALETAVGAQYYRKQLESVFARGDIFPVSE